MTANRTVLTLEDMHAEIRRLRLVRHFTKPFHKIQGRTRLRRVVRHGIQWNLQYFGVEESIIKKGHWERNSFEYFVNESRRRKCEVFLDVGAHVGYYSLLSAKMQLFEKIFAIEAMPDKFSQLQWNVNANQFGDIIDIHHIAVSNQIGELTLSNGSVCVPEQTKTTEQGHVFVPSATLDSMFDFRDKTIAIKMDIEGHEIPGLEGAEKLLSQNRVFLQIEIWPNGTKIANYLFAKGFRLLYYDGDDFYFARGFSDAK